MKNTISKMKKNHWMGLSRLDTAEEKVNEFEYITIETIQN